MPARLLVVEDNPANLELMRYLLEAYGHRALVATDGEEGLRIARRERPDLVLCDIQMAGIDGFEVLRLMKSEPALASIPVVAVTAAAMVGDRERTLAAGFTGYLSKPIDPQTFVASVEGFLAAGQGSPSIAAPSVWPASPRPGSPQAPSAKPRTLLALDNLQDHLDLVSILFGASGYRVLTASNQEKALELARATLPDVIISDICMPTGSGYEFIASVKADPGLRSIPFVFVTSTLNNEKDRQKGLALGATKFLFRPIEPQDLLREIEGCLAGNAKAHDGDDPDR